MIGSALALAAANQVEIVIGLILLAATLAGRRGWRDRVKPVGALSWGWQHVGPKLRPDRYKR